MGVLDTFKVWIDLPPGRKYLLSDAVDVRNPQGEIVGRVFVSRPKAGATDVAGRPVEQMQVQGEFERAMLGYPINVALAQAQTYTLAALGF